MNQKSKLSGAEQDEVLVVAPAENSPQAFWAVSKETFGLLFATSAFESVYGIAPQDFFCDQERFFTLLHPEEKVRVKDLRVNQLKGFKTVCEFRIQTKDGKLRVVHETTFPLFDQNGRHDRIAGVAKKVITQMAEPT